MTAPDRCQIGPELSEEASGHVGPENFHSCFQADEKFRSSKSTLFGRLPSLDTRQIVLEDHRFDREGSHVKL